MNTSQKNAVTNLRLQGLGYKKIGQKLDLSENTVKGFCKRNGLGGHSVAEPPAVKGICKSCGSPVVQTAGRKEKIFCSDTCRNRWWNAHLHQVNRHAFYSFTCPECGKDFESYGNRHRKYCSRECSAIARRKTTPVDKPLNEGNSLPSAIIV